MGMPTGVYVLANDSDPDGDPLAVSLTGASDWPFSRTTFDCWSDGNCWIEAYPHEHGTGSFGYQACDPGGLCSEANVTVTINHIPVNAYAEDDTATTEVDTASEHRRARQRHRPGRGLELLFAVVPAGAVLRDRH